jgi:hypothetical protein
MRVARAKRGVGRGGGIDSRRASDAAAPGATDDGDSVIITIGKGCRIDEFEQIPCVVVGGKWRVVEDCGLREEEGEGKREEK